MTPKFRPYCDACGERFEEGQLRPQSKFCTYCGSELSQWIRKVLLKGEIKVTDRTPSSMDLPARKREDGLGEQDESGGGRRTESRRVLTPENSSNATAVVKTSPQSTRSIES